MTRIRNGCLNFLNNGDVKNITIKNPIVDISVLDYREATRSYSQTSECLSNQNWKVFKDFKDAFEMHWNSVYSL